MTKYLHRIIILIPFALIFMTGCQQEVEEIVNPPSDQAITPNSVVADLVERTSLKDGSLDNVLDHSSCITLALPVTISIDGNQMLVTTEADLIMIENLLNELEEVDDVDLIFPVTAVLADYSEITLHNEDELENLRDECRKAGDDDDIECVDFKYPITCYLYDKENQLSDVYTIKNDKELHDLFEHFDDDKICSFEFPITVLLAGGGEVVVQDNDDLEAILKSSGNDCDEEDDHYEDHSVSDDHSGEENPVLSAILVEGLWMVAEYTDGDENKTQNYNGFQMDFDGESEVRASNGDIEVKGTWSVIIDSGIDYLVLDFGMDVLFDEFNEDWEIIEYSEEKLKLRNVSGGDGSISKLVIERM